MSLRALALQAIGETAAAMLSQRDAPSDVPPGQNAKNPYSSRDSAVPALQCSGTREHPAGTVGQLVPVGPCEAAGTNGTGGTNGTLGTSGTPPGLSSAAQREADRMNISSARQGTTDRWCRCGCLARLAWPEGGRREVWRCDDCASREGLGPMVDPLLSNTPDGSET